MSPSSRFHIGVVILAAGKGTRMQSDIPKVMHELDGKPIIEHLIAHVEESGVCEKPVVVVAADTHVLQEYLGDRAVYVVQKEQRGTGDAVRVTEDALSGTVDHVVVLYGDMPYISPESIQKLVQEHIQSGNVLTCMTATTPDFDSWRSVFHAFGRVIRDDFGNIQRVVELKDATEAERAVHEVCTCYFCFDAQWLWSHIHSLSNDNAQGEYYLVDLVQMAIDQGRTVGAVDVPLKEAIGINSKQDFDLIFDSTIR